MGVTIRLLISCLFDGDGDDIEGAYARNDARRLWFRHGGGWLLGTL